MLLATLTKPLIELSTRGQPLFAWESSVREVHRVSSVAYNDRSNDVHSRSIAANNPSHIVAKAVYFLNASILLGGLSYLTVLQKNGKYRCTSIEVTFGEEIWERAPIRLPGGGFDERLLIYSNFNGKYEGERLVFFTRSTLECCPDMLFAGICRGRSVQRLSEIR